MRKSRKYLSMPIISVSEGQQIGTVRGIVINPKLMEIAALVVDQKGFFKEQRVIPYQNVKSIGDSAITIDKVNNVEKVVSLPQIVSLMKEKVDVIGSKVITDKGKALGVVEEFYVDPDNGKILYLEIASNFLSGLFKGRARLDREYLVTIGKDILVVSAAAEESLIPVETGISETVKSVMDSTSNLWYSSVQRSKEIRINLLKGKERIELPQPEQDETELEEVAESTGVEATDSTDSTENTGLPEDVEPKEVAELESENELEVKTV